MKLTKLLTSIPLIAALSMLLVAGCSSTPDIPPRNAALEDARLAVARAEQNPTVIAYEPFELEKAKAALGEAEHIWQSEEGDFDEDDEELGEIEHLSYLAKRHAQIAEARARAHEARKSLEDAREARHQAQLNARDLQLQIARKKGLDAQKLSEMRNRLISAEEAMASMPIEIDASFRNVLFDVGKSNIKPSSQAVIDGLVGFLQANPEVRVKLEGHADDVGGQAANQVLSEKRAKAVQDALYRQGIELNRVTAIGYGEQRSAASNDTAAGRQMNRRVEVSFYPVTRSAVSSSVEVEMNSGSVPPQIPDEAAPIVDPFGPTPSEIFEGPY